MMSDEFIINQNTGGKLFIQLINIRKITMVE